MANLTEHVIINKLNKDINAAIQAVGGDTTNADGLPHYSQVIRDQLISKSAAGVISFKGVFDSLEEVDNPTKGDFVIVGEIEYVYFDKWIELGNATAAMSAIQNLRNQCVLKTDKGVDITTTSSGLQYSFKNDQMVIGKPDYQSPDGLDQVHTLKYNGGHFTIGTHRVLNNNDSSQIGKYYLDFYDDYGLQIGTSSYNWTSPCLRYNDNGLWVKHGGGDLTLRDGQFFLNLINLGSSTYDFNSDYFKITREENGSSCEILQKGGQLIIGTEQQFNYHNTGESLFVKLDSSCIKFSKIGTIEGHIGNDRYMEYTPVQIGKGGLTFTTFNKQNGSTVSHGMDANGLTRGLRFKYRDRSNNLQDSEYRAAYPIGTITNCFDITDGIYYATTCNTAVTAGSAVTASRVENPLIIHTSNGDVRYNGSTTAEVSIELPNEEQSNVGMVEVTYAELKDLRDNNQLIPGTKYRITDYVTTATGALVTSAQHKFDIIVTALTINTLSQSANAVHSKSDFALTGNIFSWSDINNWEDTNSSSIPQEILNISNTTVAKQQGSRYTSQHFNAGDIIRVTVTGYTGDYRDPSVQEDVKGLGASLHIRSTNELLSIDYGYDKDVYYLQVPKNIADNTEIAIRFYIDSVADTANVGLCGAIADKGKRYFENSDLSAWEIKYCLDNDVNRFLWADEENGKGVIYYMKDELNNECPYDFKNIKYGNRYTFNYDIALDGAGGDYIDATVKSDQLSWARICHHNIIHPSNVDDSTGIHMSLPNITTLEGCEYNTFGHDCYNITLGNYCCKNSFGNNCHDNTISNGCTLNVFGNGCRYIRANCLSFNTFGADCNSITVNVMGDGGTYPYGDLSNSSIGTGCTDLTLQTSSPKLNSYDTLQHYTIGASLTGQIEIIGDAYNRNYETKIMRNSNGEIKQYCEADLLG